MKRFLFSSFILLCCIGSTYGQRFQVTTGAPIHEEKWAVIEDAAISRYVTIGNVTNTTTFSRLWICSYNAAGVMVTSATSTNARPMIARDICLAPPDPNNTAFPRTYYVTGWTINNNGVHQMFVGRMNLTGAFLWYVESPAPTAQPFPEEGVAIAMAPNGDAVAAGHVNVQAAGIPPGLRVKLARFTSGGFPMWSNVYNTSGNWKVREIANGAPAPGCAPSPASMPGEFIITGEVNVPTATGGNGPQQTFAALYNGAGAECWRNRYPAPTTSPSNIVADAGYDVVLRSTGNYVIAGVAQMGPGRAATTSTPYFVQVNPAGGLVSAAVYLKPDGTPLGIYPRCIAKAQTTSYLACAGPDYTNNNTFYMRIGTIGAAASINRYPGIATANSVPQPFMLDDAQPEGILYTTMGITPGYLISTNAIPGAFGSSDGHLIKTDVAGYTPSKCSYLRILHIGQTAGTIIPSQSTPSQMSWSSGQITNASYQVQQKFCRDTCTVSSVYTYTQSGNTVNFTSTSTGNGTLSYLWSFGDATTSTLQNPSHTYATAGIYTVCLTVTNVSPSGDTCRAVTCKTIPVNKCDVVANFKDSVSCKYKVTYTSTSTGTGPFSYNWLFDDGTTSTVANPVKTYTRCGTHVTRLIVCNTVCCDTIFRTVNIPCCSVKSEFCLQDSGKYVKLIYNTAMNPAPTTYTVYLDGVATTWTANTYKLLTPGAHTVCLKARRVSCAGDTCCATCCKTIMVHNPCTMIADFWYQVQSNGTVMFTNKTTPAGYTSVWTFGNGSGSTLTNPSHTYAPGTYTVCLTTTSISGSDTCRSRICRKLIIEAPCKPLANFMAKYCTTTPLTVEFTNKSTGGGVYTWSFGDGTSSAVTNPIHTYTAPGSYIVCLTSTVNPNCWSMTCYKIIVSTVSCDTSCNQLPPPTTYSSGTHKENPITLESAVKGEDGVVKDNTEALRSPQPQAEIKPADELNLFPNPASQRVQVVFKSSKQAPAEVTVMNAMGSIVYRRSVSLAEGTNQVSIPIHTLANGNYFLKLNTSNKISSAMFSVKK